MTANGRRFAHLTTEPRVTRKWTTAEIPPQHGRTAIVTGANSGLGLETSAALAAAGARVVMACRNPEKAAAALAEVRARAPKADVVLMALDLANLASVRAFAAELSRQHAQLDLLINNAGILGVPFARTVDGFESQMGTNHLGHFALTGLLIDPLLATPGARVITVGSMGHWRAKPLDLDDLHCARRPYDPFSAYCQSKLANLLFMTELGRRLQTRGADLISAGGHPGGAATSIKKTEPGSFAEWRMRMMTPIALRWFINTAEIGALSTLYAATMPGVRNNDYYGPDRVFGMKGYPAPAKRSKAAQDADAARRLWQVSTEQTGVAYLD
jgi:NAD(P)-dependent dehydrogenase (short-subunit alcohol dehydrogenase family)